jgi:hypothetical protein
MKLPTSTPTPHLVRALSLSLSVLALGSVAGCVATAETGPSRGVVVSGPPPAPIHEARSAPPKPEAAWVPGYWHWTGMQYAWIPGHWDAAASGGQWIGPRYFQQGGQYRYEPGGWTRRNALR